MYFVSKYTVYLLWSACLEFKFYALSEKNYVVK